jgi:hypothetical protein
VQIQTHIPHAVYYASAVKRSAEGSKGEIVFDEAEEGQYFNFVNNVVGYTGNDEPVLYYDWMVNSATTSHICIHHNVFSTYISITEDKANPIISVKGKTTHADGHATVKVKSLYANKEYTLILKDVLHVPGNRNNLISLG